MPELSLTDFTTAGVTTAVGLLGTDSATRSPKALLAKTKALNEEGLTAYCLTGAYDIPSPTVTGSLKDDVTYLSEVLGVKVALSDHRGGHPTLEQFIHMACQVPARGPDRRKARCGTHPYGQRKTGTRPGL